MFLFFLFSFDNTLLEVLPTKGKLRHCLDLTLTMEIISTKVWSSSYKSDDLHVAIRNVLNLTSLKPCPITNSAFTCLVEAVIAAHQDHNVEKQLVKQVQQVAAAAESELEGVWARRIATAQVPALTLAEFPYCGNYEKLVWRELELVAQSGRDLNFSGVRILFIGSGPLAMTSILLHKALPRAYIENVDICPKAIAMSQHVAKALALRGCGFTCADGATVKFAHSVPKFDLILIAALAGATQASKQAIIDNLKPALAANGRLLLRSAAGARELLYPAVQVGKLSGVEVLLEHHPSDDVINSVIVCRYV